MRVPCQYGVCGQKEQEVGIGAEPNRARSSEKEAFYPKESATEMSKIARQWLAPDARATSIRSRVSTKGSFAVCTPVVRSWQNLRRRLKLQRLPDFQVSGERLEAGRISNGD